MDACTTVTGDNAGPRRPIPGFLTEFTPTRGRRRLSPFSRTPAHSKMGETWQVAAKTAPDELVIVDRPPDIDRDGPTVRTYSEWAGRVDRSAWLSQAGVRPWDRVAILKASHLDIIILRCAVARIGAIPCMFSGSYGPEAMIPMLERLERAFLLTDREYIDKCGITPDVVANLTVRTISVDPVAGRPDIAKLDDFSRGERSHRRGAESGAATHRSLRGPQPRWHLQLHLEPRRGRRLGRLEVVPHYIDNLKAVRADDVKRVATTYLVPEHATVGWFVPGPAKPQAPMNEVAKTAVQDDAAAPAAAKMAAAPASGSFAQRTTRKVLANGIILDVIENHSVPTVAIRGMAFAGDTTSPAGKPAIAALTARMLARGTKTRSKEQIGALLDNVGATRSYVTNVTDTAISANGLSRDLALLVEIVADELKNAAFGADELAKAKKELENAYVQTADNTSARAFERFQELVYREGHPYFAPGKDKLVASAGSVTADELRAFIRRATAARISSWQSSETSIPRR